MTLALTDLRAHLAPLANTDGPGGEVAAAQAVIAALREVRLICATAPEAWGGPGYSMADTARLLFEVSRVSGSAGLTLAMHLSQFICLCRHGIGAPLLEAAGRRLQEEQGLIASVASEANVGGDIFGTQCQITGGVTGWQLTKETPNTSYVPDAAAFLVTALEDKETKPKIRLALAWADTTRAEPLRRNALMGMQGIDNHAWRFQFEIAQDAVFETPFQVIARDSMTPASHIMWAAVWSGLASSALQKAGRFVAKELKTNPEVQSDMTVTLATLRTRHYQMNALIRDAIALWEAGPPHAQFPLNAGARLNRLKISVSEGAVAITQGTLAIVGLRGFAETGGYSVTAEIRDAMSGPLMVSNHRLMRNTIQADRFAEEAI